MAVVLFHLVHIGGVAPASAFEFIGRDFGYSVHLFFILSAFSLMYSTEPTISRARWVSEYLMKRFFRIAPLFYFVLALEIGRQVVATGGVVTDFRSIILEMTFAFGFVPYSGIVWGGWSVGVEMIFYVIFPIILISITTPRAALLFLIVCLVISFAIRSALNMQYMALSPQPAYGWSYFAFGSNLCFFAMGIFAYRAGSQYRDFVIANEWLMGFFVLSVLGGLALLGVGKYLHGEGRWDIVTWGVGLMALCLWQSVSPGRVIANRFFEYLGERSFSIYLLHPVVITFFKDQIVAIYKVLAPYIGSAAFFVCAIPVGLLVLLFAELTYRFVEIPGIGMGRNLIIKGRIS